DFEPCPTNLGSRFRCLSVSQEIVVQPDTASLATRPDGLYNPGAFPSTDRPVRRDRDVVRWVDYSLAHPTQDRRPDGGPKALGVLSRPNRPSGTQETPVSSPACGR